VSTQPTGEVVLYQLAKDIFGKAKYMIKGWASEGFFPERGQ